METPTRNTAYKIWISSLIRSEYAKEEGEFGSWYINLNGKKISRVNLICSVVDRYSGEGYASITVDDGSGIIAVKAWGEDTKLLLDFDVGNSVMVVGKVRQYGGLYIIPEIVKKLDNPFWLKLRKLELVKEYGESERVEGGFSGNASEYTAEDVIEEKVESGNSREKVIGLIESLDAGSGADMAEVIQNSGLESAEDVIRELIQDGAVFELHKGRLRAM